MTVVFLSLAGSRVDYVVRGCDELKPPKMESGCRNFTHNDSVTHGEGESARFNGTDCYCKTDLCNDQPIRKPGRPGNSSASGDGTVIHAASEASERSVSVSFTVMSLVVTAAQFLRNLCCDDQHQRDEKATQDFKSLPHRPICCHRRCRRKRSGYILNSIMLYCNIYFK